VLQKKFVQYYQIFCNLSLDVVLGVLFNALVLPHCFSFNSNLGWYVGLPGATWLIYLIDHLVDVKRNPKTYSPRHAFIRQYFFHVIITCAVLALLCCWLAYTFYNLSLLITACTTLMFCLIYFLLTQIKYEWLSYLYNKELLVASIYATAMYMPVGLGNQGNWYWLFFYLIFIGLAYCNLLMLSIIEQPTDVAQRQFSWVLIIGKNRAVVLFKAIIMITSLLCILVILQSRGLQQHLGLCYLIMAWLHYILFAYAPTLQPNETYRKLSEMIFWLPAIVWIFIHLT
jgi:hypothetical protein